jgi:hypothetical protein
MICVDPIFDTEAFKSPQWRYQQACHMYASEDTTVPELVEFAVRIGCKPEWLQGVEDGRFPHFDLTPNMRDRAVRAGAVERTRREMGLAMRVWRERLDAGAGPG